MNAVAGGIAGGGFKLDKIICITASLSKTPPASIAVKIRAVGAAISKSAWHLLCALIPTLAPIFNNLSPIVVDWQFKKLTTGESYETIKVNHDVIKTDENSSLDKL